MILKIIVSIIRFVYLNTKDIQLTVFYNIGYYYFFVAETKYAFQKLIDRYLEWIYKNENSH